MAFSGEGNEIWGRNPDNKSVPVAVDEDGQLLVDLTASTIEIGTVDQGTGGTSAWKVDGSAVTQPVSGPLTDAQLRATPVPVSGTVATGGLTDAQLRASPVPISGTVTANAGSGTLLVDGSAHTQPVSGTVTATQATGTNLHAVIDSGSTTAVTGNVTVVQSTGSNLHVVNDASSAVIGHVIADSGSTTAVTGNVTVVQGTGSNLHVAVDSAPTTAVTQSGSWTTGRTWDLNSGTDEVTVVNSFASNLFVSAVESGLWTVQPFNTALYSVSLPANSNYATITSTSFADALAHLSAAFWIRTTDTRDFAHILSKANDATGNGGWNIQTHLGAVYFNFWKPLAAGNYSGYTAGLINDGRWHHVLMTYDSVAGVVIYIDGVSQSLTILNATIPGTNYSSSNALAIGDALNDTEVSFLGNLADLRIWNTTLTSGNATTLAQGGSVAAGLIGNWLFTEGTGTTATDQVASRVFTFTGVTWSKEIGQIQATGPLGPVTQVTNFPTTQQVSGTGNFTVVQGTGSNLHTVIDAGSAVIGHVINDASSAVIGHVIADSGSTTAVTGNVTVTQGTGTNLHTVVDSGTLTAVTAITNALPAGSNVIGHVITDSGSTVSVSNFPATQIVKELNTSSSAVSRVASSASSHTLAASNSNRRGLLLYNDGTANQYVKFGATATVTDFTVKMVANAYYELPTPVYSGVVDCISSNTNGAIQVTELS